MIVNFLTRKIRERSFIIEGFSFFDLFNPFYIERKSIYEFMKFCGKKYITTGNEAVLDFGCGEKPYRSLFKTSNYIGVDVEISGHTKIEGGGTADVFYDGYILPFQDCSFDILISNQVFEHVIDFPLVFSECTRVLKQDGIMIMTVPLCSEEHEKPYDFRRFTIYGLKNVIKENNLEILFMKKNTSYKNALRSLKCIYYCHYYRNFLSGIKMALVCFFENFLFLFSKNKYYTEDDFANDIFVICKKTT